MKRPGRFVLAFSMTDAPYFVSITVMMTAVVPDLCFLIFCIFASNHNRTLKIMALFGLLGAIPHIIVLIATILYVSKRFTIEAFLMVIGAVTGLISFLFFTVGIPLMSIDYGLEYQSFMSIFSAISTLGSLAFAIGLLILLQKLATSKE